MTENSPIYNEPALLLNNKILVIADLHLGLELELRNEGINLPSQSDDILKKILNLCKSHKIRKLIVLGDLKHKVPSISYQELRDARRFVEKLLQQCSVEIITGNHDSAISKLLPKAVKIYSSKGVVVEGVGLFHGHAYPSEDVLACEQIITAHIHPVVALSAGFATLAEPCWVKYKAKSQNIIIMPAFNKLCSYVINKNKLRLRPPLSKIIDFSKASVYLLDGTLLGKVYDLTRK